MLNQKSCLCILFQFFCCLTFSLTVSLTFASPSLFASCTIIEPEVLLVGGTEAEDVPVLNVEFQSDYSQTPQHFALIGIAESEDFFNAEIMDSDGNFWATALIGPDAPYLLQIYNPAADYMMVHLIDVNDSEITYDYCFRFSDFGYECNIGGGDVIGYCCSFDENESFVELLSWTDSTATIGFGFQNNYMRTFSEINPETLLEEEKNVQVFIDGQFFGVFKQDLNQCDLPPIILDIPNTFGGLLDVKIGGLGFDLWSLDNISAEPQYGFFDYTFNNWEASCFANHILDVSAVSEINCSLEIVETSFHEVNSFPFFENFPILSLKFSKEDVASQNFIVNVNGSEVETFILNSEFLDIQEANPFDNIEYLGIELTPEMQEEFSIEILSADNPTCSASYQNEGSGIAACSISNLSAEQILPCDENGQFFVTIGFDVEDPTSNNFEILGNGQNYGIYSYDEIEDGSITIGPIGGAGVFVDEFIVRDAEDLECSQAAVVFWAPCAIVVPGCGLSNLFAEAYDCNDFGEFLIDYEFDFEGFLGAFFEVSFSNDETYVIDYLSMQQNGFLTAGPFLAGSQENWSITVNLLDDPDCFAAYELGEIMCEPSNDNCNISNVVAEPWPCDETGQFLVDIYFTFENVGESFTIVGNGMDYGNFQYEEGASDALVSIGPLGQDDIEIYEFIVIDNSMVNCSDFTEMSAPACNSGECFIEIVDQNIYPCSETGFFSIDLYIEYANPPSNQFSIVDENGTLYGGFQYTILDDYGYVNIGPIGTFIDDNYEFTVYDIEDSGCSDTFILSDFDCDDFSCQIFDVIAEPTPCDENGQFYIDISFWYINPNSATFSVVGDGNNYGVFDYAQINDQGYVTIGPISAMPQTELEFGIVDGVCSEFTSVYFEGCTDETCDIGIVYAYASDCDEDGNFIVDIEFEYLGSFSEGFEVFGNGVSFGTFSYEEILLNGSVQIEVPNQQGENSLFFYIEDLEDEFCSGSTAIQVPPCDDVSCYLYDAFAEAFPCDENGGYLVYIDFAADNPSGETFTVASVFGESYGTFLYSEMEEEGIIIGPIYDIEFGTELYITDDVNPLCLTFVNYEPPICNGILCSIEDVYAEMQPCNEDGSFFVDIAFEYFNTGDQGFTIFGNGNDYGIFSFDEMDQNGFVTIGPINVMEGTELEFIVSDNSLNACVGFTGFIFDSCGPIELCEFSNLSVEVGACLEEEEYEVLVNFEYTGVAGLGFDVFLNDEPIGFYPYSDLPLNVVLPNQQAGSINELMVAENDQPFCSTSTVFEAPDCGAVEACSISNLFAEAHDCDENGQFLVDITFDYNNVTSPNFSIFGDGNFYGLFGINEIDENGFVTIGPFDEDAETVYGFVVQVQEQLGTCSSEDYFLGPISCNEADSCAFSNLSAINLCGTLSVDFDYSNVTNQFFDLSLDGELLDSYAYSDLPLSIELDEMPDQILISDNDNPDCFIDETISFVECMPCEITDLIANRICISEETVEINFNHNNAINQFFDLYVDGLFYDSYEFASLPLELELDLTAAEIKVSEKDNSDCFAEALIFDGVCPGIYDEIFANVSILLQDGNLQIQNLPSFDEINVYDLSGRTIFSVKAQAGEQSFFEQKIPAHADAMYIIEIQKDGQRYHRKVFGF